MNTVLEYLQDTFRISYDVYEGSRVENDEIMNLYHNRQYTPDQLETLKRRGQPQETFNVIKLFARLLVGYYSTVVNTVRVNPRQFSDIGIASLLNDLVSFTFKDNEFETEGEKCKLDGILSGLMCAYIYTEDTGARDEFNRPINRVKIEHVPSSQIVIDPSSTLEDYSDANYIHRFKWILKESLIKLFPTKKSEIDKLQPYDNHLNQQDTEFEYTYSEQFQGLHRNFDNFLLVHSQYVDKKDQIWSIFWCGDTILQKERIFSKGIKFNYRVHKLHSSNKAEYYGLFRDVAESQKAINQAIIKIQLMVNSQKVVVAKGGVDDIDAFKDQFNRVNGILEVLRLNKVQIINTTQDIQFQYAIVDKAFNRIQQVLGINDSFLGQAFASDSGRKVKMQKDSTTLALRYVTTKIEQFYRLLGKDIVFLIKEHYTAHQTLRIVDETTGKRWMEINKPLELFSGVDENGQPVTEYMYEEVIDKQTNEPLIIDGQFVIAPVALEETELSFGDVDIDIDTVAYNDEDERNQLFIDNVLQGHIGDTLRQVNMSGYLRVAALGIKGVRSKNSIDIAQILEETAQGLSGQAQPPIQGGSKDKGIRQDDSRIPQFKAGE